MDKRAAITATGETQGSLSAILARIEKRANRATPGPWDFHGQSRTFAISHVMNGVHQPRVIKGDTDRDEGEDWRTSCGGVITMPDAAFIAAARTDLPKLIEAVRIAMDGLEGNYGPTQKDMEQALKDMEAVLNRKG